MPKTIQSILRPRSVAVIGASKNPGRLGYEVLHNLLTYGFEGAVYPVNPVSDHVHSLRAYKSVEDIPDPVDLAVIVVPRDQVLASVQACARKGVKGLVIVSAGFREVGGEGKELEDRIVEVVRENGMRMVGPNCMGVINADPEIRLNASFGTTHPDAGNAAFASQSGALGEVIMSEAKAVGIGTSQFVSLGNKADVSGNDLLEWWAADPQTEVILLYLESFGNPKKFASLARRVTRTYKKPILAVKSGRTRQGAAAASSHTGSLAGGDRAATSLFAHCGIMRCNTVEQLFDLARGFCNQPLPRGRRVAVLTNAGGPGIMCTDSLVYFGLEMADLAPETVATLKSVLPDAASVRNPVDMIASAGPKGYRACTEALLADPGVDALVCIFVSPIIISASDVAQAIVDGVAAGRRAAGVDKPVLASIMGKDTGRAGVEILRRAGLPNFAFPETAAHTLAAMASYDTWLSQPEGEVRQFTVERERATRVLADARAAGRDWITGRDALDLLDAYGIQTVPSAYVDTPEQAIAFAEEHGFPVVLKVDREDLVHKSDVGGVHVDLRSAREIKGAFWEINQGLEKAGLKVSPHATRFLVQKMVTGGQETIIGATEDAMVGHLLMFGLGGVFVELMEDVVFRVHPITDADAARMVREVRGFPLLTGHRGAPPCDVAGLEHTLLCVNQLVADFPEIAEMDLNPFLVLPAGRGGVAVDVRVRLRPAGTEVGQRRL